MPFLFQFPLYINPSYFPFSCHSVFHQLFISSTSIPNHEPLYPISSIPIQYTMYLLPSPFYLLPSTESSGSIVINFGNSNFNFFSSSSQNAFQTFRSIFGFVSVVSVCSQFLVTAFPPTVFIRLG
uniref:Uncharacterized protein n=1 Tax=Cacopsylla melanoneura TaxID=428564 RepID=A0A8D8VX69_9HEMI